MNKTLFIHIFFALRASIGKKRHFLCQWYKRYSWSTRRGHFLLCKNKSIWYTKNKRIAFLSISRNSIFFWSYRTWLSKLFFQKWHRNRIWGHFLKKLSKHHLKTRVGNRILGHSLDSSVIEYYPCDKSTYKKKFWHSIIVWYEQNHNFHDLLYFFSFSHSINVKVVPLIPKDVSAPLTGELCVIFPIWVKSFI